MNATNFRINDLPDIALEQIFLNLSDNCLINVAVRVCKKWKSIIDNESFWLNKCLINRRLTREQIETLKQNGFFEYKKINFSNVFKKNLIKNSCAADSFTHWCLLDEFEFEEIDNLEAADFQELVCKYNEDFKLPTNEREWTIEEHVGAEPIFDENEQPIKNFVTSHIQTYKMQVIDLNHKGATDLIQQMVNKSISIKLSINESYSARWDCGSEYKLAVFVLDEKFNLVEKFAFEDEFPQWSEAKWQCVKHDFEIKKPFRYVIFLHGGRDTQFWAGFYGSKMTKSVVRISL